VLGRIKIEEREGERGPTRWALPREPREREAPPGGRTINN